MEAFDRELGQRLREVRKRRGLTLQEVEKLSEGTFRVSVLGSYERGERSLSVERLKALADLYKISVAELMGEGPRASREMEAVRSFAEKVAGDLLELSGRLGDAGQIQPEADQ